MIVNSMCPATNSNTFRGVSLLLIAYSSRFMSDHKVMYQLQNTETGTIKYNQIGKH